jgi:iron complex transport system permease protein
MAFGFGLTALVLAGGLAKLAGRGGALALVLAGVVVSTFFHAMVGFAETLADPDTKLPSIIFWLLGSFASATYAKVTLVAAITGFAGGLLCLLRWRINLLTMDLTDAEALGVPVERLRWAVIVLVALIVAAQVSVSGGVGWVGVIIPHLARMMVGANHSRLLPVSALLGGVYLLAMDDLARCISVQELPIGLLTAGVGAPIFAVVFWQTHKTGWTA